MNFDNSDLIPMLARERQQRLIQEAAERSLVRRAKQAHPAAGRWSRLFHHDPAS